MDLNQLEYFKALAHINHFTQTAQNLSVSQPALSRSIAKLEAELGVPLFERSGKNIKLTQYGQLFLTHIERALQEISNGKQALADLSSPDRGVIHLSFLHSLGGYIVPMLISNFNKIYPNIKFRLHQYNSSQLTKRLTEGSCDLCLCSTIITTGTLGWVPLCSEELFVIVPNNHHFAKRKSLDLKEIAQESIITFKSTYGLRLLANQFFEAASIHPNITFEGDEIATVAGLVDANLGVSLIPHIPGLEHLNITFIPVSAPRCTRPLGMAWNINKYLSPAAKKFQQFVIDTFNEKQNKN